MHKCGISHRDIKLENILLDAEANALLCDLGFSSIQESGRLHECKGTPGYMAPEMFTEEGYLGAQVDVFALGVTLFALKMGRPPFQHASMQDEFYATMVNDPTRFWASWHEYSRAHSIRISDEFQNLIMKMLSHAPDDRPTIDQILAHEWMQGSTEIPLCEMSEGHDLDIQKLDTAGSAE